MLTLVMPMAGRGSRFKAAGYVTPKPMILIEGVPMVERVRQNMPQADKLIVVALEEHAPYIRPWAQGVCDKGEYVIGVHVTYIPEVTAGAACTVYGIIEEVHPESELLVANCDQWMDWSPAHFIDYCRRSGASVTIPSFRATGNKWSYCVLREDETVREVFEKPLFKASDIATCGVYWWRIATDCFSAIERMVQEDERTNGEFYLAPSINWLIREDGHRVLTYPVAQMVGLGTPEDLQAAMANGIFGSVAS